MSTVKCKEVTEAAVTHNNEMVKWYGGEGTPINLNRAMQSRKRSLTSMGWIYHL